MEAFYTLIHEYGHFIQNQIIGELYLFKIGIPSYYNFGSNWTEEDANYRADKYFREHSILNYNSTGMAYYNSDEFIEHSLVTDSDLFTEFFFGPQFITLHYLFR